MANRYNMSVRRSRSVGVIAEGHALAKALQQPPPPAVMNPEKDGNGAVLARRCTSWLFEVPY